MTSPLLHVSELTVRTTSRVLINSFSFSVSAGQILGLFGASGSGKTTILHALFGLQDARLHVSGDIRLNGLPLSDLPAEKRSRLGMSIVLQELGLFDDRSVFENVAYPLRQRANSETAIRRAVMETLAIFQIEDLAQRSPGTLSGGQRQRVALARALVYKPLLLLLDEPLRGLQEELRLQFLAFIRSIASNGTGVIFVTHERSELQLVANSVVQIANGVLVECEDQRKGEPFESLLTHVLVPKPNHPGAYIRISNLRLPAIEKINPERSYLNVTIHEWRALPGSRRAAFVTFSNNEPGWLIFDLHNIEGPTSLLGPSQIEYDETGGVAA